jgi:carbamoyltransferase
VRDGVVVAFAEEERFNRLKTSKGLFPSRTVRWCLESNGLTLSDIHHVAFGWDATAYPFRTGAHYARTYLKYCGAAWRAPKVGSQRSAFTAAAELLLLYHPDRARSAIQDGLRAAGLNGDFPPIRFVRHHLAHAYSVYPLSGFERAGILTIDGSGEIAATQLALGEGNDIRVLEEIALPHSLGWFYAAVTQYLGFIPYRDEGKLMGLAALGEANRDSNKWLEPLSRMLRVGRDSYEVDPTLTFIGGHYYASRYTDAFVERITAIDPEATPIGYGNKAALNGNTVSRYLLPTYIDMAWAAQELLEQAAIALAGKLVREHGIQDLCIAGGVGLNCKMNGEILRRSGIKRIFVQPAAYDSGAAVGAALYVAREAGENIRRPLKHAFAGPAFDNDAVRGALETAKLPYKAVDDPAAEAARRLERGEIVGWFQGQMEFGARSLGGRSILGNPLMADMKDRINAEVKYREGWRPFCPSVLDGAQERYIVEPGEAGYMIVAYDATEICKTTAPSVLHVDGTIRPQVVRQGAHARFHALIKEFGQATGHPIVLNTSLNMRGEPIALSPLDAVRCYFSTGLDALVIENFVLAKRG